MKKILLLGAGKSAFCLIEKLLANAASKQWVVDVADVNYAHAQSIIGTHSHVKAIALVENQDFSLVENYEVCISMLPPHLHAIVARQCLKFGVHFITASYNSEEIQSLHEEAKAKKLVFLMECGLDPGIDHMSAMQIINDLKQNGATITSFTSYCGGLMSKTSDIGNPWKYKITWNPRNVVLAGQGTFVKYLKDGALKHINYARLFKNPELIEVEQEKYEGYPNRDSLQYIDKYGLQTATTFIRGTLRKQGFCKAWDALIQLGLTDDSTQIKNSPPSTFKSFFQSLLPFEFDTNWEQNFKKNYPNLVDAEVYEQLIYLGLLSDEKIEFETFTPAKLLQHLLENKLKLTSNDKDSVVLHHEVKYTDASGNKFIKSAHLLLEGQAQPRTAMAKTVGLPIYYALETILESNQIEFGVQLPIKEWIYKPILHRLSNEGIIITENTFKEN